MNDEHGSKQDGGSRGSSEMEIKGEGKTNCVRNPGKTGKLDIACQD